MKNKLFLKSDLKSEMLLKFKNGAMAIVKLDVDELGDWLTNPIDIPLDMKSNTTTRGPLKNLTVDLYYNFHHNNKPVKSPCIAIYGNTYPGRWGFSEIRSRKLIWHRYKQVKPR